MFSAFTRTFGELVLILAVAIPMALWAYWGHYDRISALGLEQYKVDKEVALYDKHLSNLEVLTVRYFKFDVGPAAPKAPVKGGK